MMMDFYKSVIWKNKIRIIMNVSTSFIKQFAEWLVKTEMSKILIKNGRIWDGGKFIFADVLTEGNKVVEISADINKDAEFVYDAREKTVLPGLVDAHVHMKGISADIYGTNTEMSCIPFGVTAAVDASGSYGDKNLLDSFLVKSLVLVCSEVENGILSLHNAKKMLRKYGERAIGVKVYMPKIKSIDMLCKISEFAQENGLITVVHTTDSEFPMNDILNVLKKGDIFTHAYHGGKYNVSDDDFECIRSAKNKGIIIDAGLAGHVHTDFEIYRNAILSNAAPDIISTDITKLSAYKRGGIYGMTMCMSIAKYLGMREEDIFRAVTSSAAKAVGKENEWGVLKVGGYADIAVLDENGKGFDLTDKAGHRIVCDTGYRCVLTAVNGEIVYRV